MASTARHCSLPYTGEKEVGLVSTALVIAEREGGRTG